MFKLPEITAALVALVLIAMICVYGFFHITIGGLAVMLLVLVVGALIGIALGRNSKTANAAFNRAEAEIENWRTRTRRENADAAVAEAEAKRRGNG